MIVLACDKPPDEDTLIQGDSSLAWGLAPPESDNKAIFEELSAPAVRAHHLVSMDGPGNGQARWWKFYRLSDNMDCLRQVRRTHRKWSQRG
jgi:hypothetical protein